MKRMIKIIVILSLLIIPCGCWDLKEVDNIYYVNAVGFDYQDGKYYFYAQINDFSPMAKMESSGGGDTEISVWLGRGVGKSFQEAYFDLLSNSERRISWGHLTALVFTERALDKVLKDIVDAQERYPEVRLTDWVFGTDASLEKVFTTMPIIFGSPLYSQLGDPVDVYQQRSFIKPIRFHELIRSMNEPGKNVLIPNLTLSDRTWQGGDKDVSSVKMQGMYVVSDFKKVGKLTDRQLSGLRWLQKETRRAMLVLYHEDKPFAEMYCFDPKIKIKPHVVKGGKVHFDIDVKTRAQIVILEKPYSHTYLKKMAETEIENQIRHTFKEAVKQNIDIFNFSYYLYRNHPQVWKKVTKETKLPLSEDTLQTVRVDVTIGTGKKRISEVPWIKRGYDKKK